jgi:hypothetical protein
LTTPIKRLKILKRNNDDIGYQTDKNEEPSICYNIEKNEVGQKSEFAEHENMLIDMRRSQLDIEMPSDEKLQNYSVLHVSRANMMQSDRETSDLERRRAMSQINYANGAETCTSVIGQVSHLRMQSDVVM